MTATYLDIRNMIPVSFNGLAINDGSNYNSRFPEGYPLQMQAKVINTPRVDNVPVFSGKSLAGRTIPLSISIVGGSMNELMKYFDTTDTANQYKLIVKNDNGTGHHGDGSQWYVYATVTDAPKYIPSADPNNKGALLVTLSIADTIFRNTSVSNDSWAITSSPATGHVLNLNGNKFARPIFTITPTSTKGADWLEKRYVLIYNQVAKAAKAEYMDITGQTGKALDTSSRSHFLASGNDIRVLQDGAPIDYWLTGINTSGTGIHVQMNLQAGIILTLNGSIAGSGAISKIAVKKTSTNLAALKLLASVSNKIVVIVSAGGKEIFSFTGVDVVGDASNYYITGTTRQQKDSTTFPNVAHADNDNIYWVEHDVWILFNNSAASAPDINQNNKPMQDLSNSTNASWVWSSFYDNTAARPGSWIYNIIATLNKNLDLDHRSTYYTADQYTYANPATEMGAALFAFMVSNKWRPETGTIAWRFQNPFGFTSVTTSGKKMALNGNATGAFPAVAGVGLFKSADGKLFTQVFSEAAPTVANTWQALTNNASAKSLSGTYYILEYRLSGSISASANQAAYIQYDTITAARDTAKTPVIVLGAIQNTYYLASIIKNATSGESFTINLPFLTGTALTIDCDKRKITAPDGSVIPSVPPVFIKSSDRADWLNLGLNSTGIFTGVASLSFTDPSTGNVTFATQWEDRANAI